MRSQDVMGFLGLWEKLHNPDFKPLEFERFRKQAGANAFTMSPKKWIEATDAIGIVSKAGLSWALKGAESLCIHKTKSTLHYRFIISEVL